MATKITKTQNFNAIREILVNANKPELVAFVDHELELIANKAAKRSSTPTKAQKEGAIIKGEILATLTSNGEAMRIADIIAANPALTGMTPQRISAQLTKLIDENKVVKEVVKRVNYYKAV